MSLRDKFNFAQGVLSTISLRLASDDPGELFWAVCQLARIRYFSEADLAVVGAEILLARDRDALKRVVPCLRHREENLRHFAIEALGIVGEDAASHLDEISSVLEEYPEDGVWALMAVGKPAVPYLATALRSEISRVRLAAVDALIDDPIDVVAQLKEEVLDLLNDPDPRIRLFALEALKSIASEASPDSMLGRIVPLRDDQDEDVRTTASRVLALLQRRAGQGQGDNPT